MINRFKTLLNNEQQKPQEEPSNNKIKILAFMNNISQRSIIDTMNARLIKVLRADSVEDILNAAQKVANMLLRRTNLSNSNNSTTDGAIYSTTNTTDTQYNQHNQYNQYNQHNQQHLDYFLYERIKTHGKIGDKFETCYT